MATTCANLGIGLAQEGKKVLLIDGDPQGSLTISLGYDRPDNLPVTLSDMMGKVLTDTPILLLAACIGTLTALCISGRVFAGMYAIQLFISVSCLLFLVICHRRRAAFVLRSEWKYIVISAVVVTISFLAYYLATAGIANHISNFGVYLPVLFFFISVHGIVRKEHNVLPLMAIFSRKQPILIICSILVLIGVAVLFLGGGYEELLISINILFSTIYLCNIVLAQNLKNKTSSITIESGYHAALQQLQQEELLKTDFADFLHDDILQDLLAIKNMMSKAYRPDIQDIIIETLDRLNTNIRRQMQDYHPDDLITAMIHVSHGNTCFPSENTDIIIEDLTSMEKKVLQLICSGKKRKDFADELYMSERTLSNHLQHIFEKLDVSSAVEAVTKAIQLGYIPPIS